MRTIGTWKTAGLTGSSYAGLGVSGSVKATAGSVTRADTKPPPVRVVVVRWRGAREGWWTWDRYSGRTPSRARAFNLSGSVDPSTLEMVGVPVGLARRTGRPARAGAGWSR